jgi:hypothetical protein
MSYQDLVSQGVKLLRDARIRGEIPWQSLTGLTGDAKEQAILRNSQELRKQPWYQELERQAVELMTSGQDLPGRAVANYCRKMLDAPTSPDLDTARFL